MLHCLKDALEYRNYEYKINILILKVIAYLNDKAHTHAIFEYFQRVL